MHPFTTHLRALLPFLWLLAAAIARADGWSTSIAVSRISTNDLGVDLTLNTLSGSLGYSFGDGKPWQLLPEVRIGSGLGHDTVDVGGPVKTSVDNLLVFAVRGEYHVEQLYFFVQPAVGRVEFQLDFEGTSFFADDWDSGIGAGIGYNLTETSAVELSLEDFGSSTVRSIGIRFDF